MSSKPVRLVYTLVCGIIGAFIFKWIHMPIPWLLGPMIVTLVASRSIKQVKPLWPPVLRNAGMIIIGYTVGLSFTLSTLQQIGRQLPSMILLTVLLLVCSLLIALLISFLSGVPFPTVLMGSIPGGLTQMIPLAEEIKGIDITVVTFLQVSRLMMIIFFVPLLVFSPLFGGTGAKAVEAAVSHASSASWEGLFPHIMVFAVVCTLLGIAGQRIKFPTAYLLGPMIGTVVLNLSGYSGHALPSVFLNASQLVIGIYVGMLLKPEQLGKKLRIILLAAFSGVLLILCSMGLSLLLTRLHAVTMVTAFLGLAPGGMDQMGIMAKEAGADLSVVICYQLFRTLFIFLAVPPLLKAIFKAMLRKQPSGT
ncbi:AbrB family transcriptional regulator [Paenibacillus sp. HJL G12]|uniref:AbrB family transcriptional regulator n=1 Tax=Paenibacillus dendrobii TaxID=2691084 RepID=A0A7X3INX8_9BACL|nr:AbrB family transcriptional regulator [Paenibacillus dendrobii]MWV46771.1 AbrB family transcriptional regulator [Paenibacillus dendrobii]